jgi:hypothetical protein
VVVSERTAATRSLQCRQQIRRHVGPEGFRERQRVERGAVIPHTNLFNDGQVIGVYSHDVLGAGSGSLANIAAALLGWLLDGLRPGRCRRLEVAEERPAKPKVGVPSRYLCSLSTGEKLP